MNTAGRRRAQAIAGYKHICPRMRPHFSAISAEKSAARERCKVDTANRIRKATKPKK